MKINGFDISNFNPIVLNENWLSKIKAIPHNDANLKIGKLEFKRALIHPDTTMLIFCNKKFEPVPGEKVISTVHLLQNFYFEKTGEELQIDL